MKRLLNYSLSEYRQGFEKAKGQRIKKWALSLFNSPYLIKATKIGKWRIKPEALESFIRSRSKD